MILCNTIDGEREECVGGRKGDRGGGREECLGGRKGAISHVGTIYYVKVQYENIRLNWILRH